MFIFSSPVAKSKCRPPATSKTAECMNDGLCVDGTETFIMMLILQKLLKYTIMVLANFNYKSVKP